MVSLKMHPVKFLATLRVIISCSSLWSLPVDGFAFIGNTATLLTRTSAGRSQPLLSLSQLSESSTGNGGAWNGEVVSNDPKGRIRGCSIQLVDGTMTEWIVTIDGEEADLGKFSEAIYKKITADAKRERFQGFRPGTIPPHLEPTYRAFTMDECARETTLEAMAQNNIRPFDSTREEMIFESFAIPPPVKKGKKSKKSKKKKGTTESSAESEAADAQPVPQMLTFDTMKECIDAGWRPGQSFSFIAKDVKGQQLKDQDVAGSTSLGLSY